MKRVIIVKADDWEALFIDGILIEQDHKIEEGEDRGWYFLKLASKYNFTHEDIQMKWVNDEGNKHLYDNGYFSGDLKDNLKYIENER